MFCGTEGVYSIVLVLYKILTNSNRRGGTGIRPPFAFEAFTWNSTEENRGGVAELKDTFHPIDSFFMEAFVHQDLKITWCSNL
jgi:hypothetical protein